MDFSERPPSQQWAALKYSGEPFAEVWFKPDGEPFALTFRIPQTSFEVPAIGQRLTAESLLNAVGIATAEVGSWRHEGASPSSTNASQVELTQFLPPPLPGVAHLHLYVSLKPPLQAVASQESGEPEISEAWWQEIETRWNTVQILEASVETLRISMEALRVELEALAKKALTGDDKLYAMNADVAQWTKAKSRVLFALPKAREFIHRATWATTAPERKQLQELFKEHLRPRIPFPQRDEVAEELLHLLKTRRVLASHGNSVYQDCKSIAAEVQATLRTLQRNAAARATKKRAATSAKGKLR